MGATCKYFFILKKGKNYTVIVFLLILERLEAKYKR